MVSFHSFRVSIKSRTQMILSHKHRASVTDCVGVFPFQSVPDRIIWDLLTAEVFPDGSELLIWTGRSADDEENPAPDWEKQSVA